jgi:hypothetical protein
MQIIFVFYIERQYSEDGMGIQNASLIETIAAVPTIRADVG